MREFFWKILHHFRIIIVYIILYPYNFLFWSILHIIHINKCFFNIVSASLLNFYHIKFYGKYKWYCSFPSVSLPSFSSLLYFNNPSGHFGSHSSSTLTSLPFLLLFRAVVSTVTVHLCKVPYILCNFLPLLSWLSSPLGFLRAHSLTTWKRVFLPPLSNPLSLKFSLSLPPHLSFPVLYILSLCTPGASLLGYCGCPGTSLSSPIQFWIYRGTPPCPTETSKQKANVGSRDWPQVLKRVWEAPTTLSNLFFS